ncbi:hypothetical protein TNCV_4874681 [Trichonephila clavipes]|nr:hypothetical protein TNCV_4874681 [Trichonephila clavipes]
MDFPVFDRGFMDDADVCPKENPLPDEFLKSENTSQMDCPDISSDNNLKQHMWKALQKKTGHPLFWPKPSSF